MTDGVVVAVVESIDDLLEEDESFLLRQPPALHQIVKQLPALDVLQNEVQLRLALVDLVQHHHILMPNQLH